MRRNNVIVLTPTDCMLIGVRAFNERGLRPTARNQGGSNQSLTTASNGDLRSQREKLYSMLQEACDDLPPTDSPEGTTSPGGARKQESPEEGQISTAIVNAEKLIKMVSATRGTKGINKKAEQQKQEKHKQDELQKAEQQWKSKFSDVINWLNKLVKQIDDSKYDEKDFTKSKNIAGSHEEVNKCNAIILDCCRKLKNENDSKTSIETEVASLLEDIKAWGDTKPPKKANVNTCKVVESLRDSRSKLRERILEFKSIETEVASLLEDIKAWDDTKPPKKANGNASTVVEALRDSRSKLRERILEFKSANKEMKLLLNEIKEWNDIKTINEAKEDCKDKVVKEFREGRLQVHKWKKEFKSAKEEVDCLTKDLKSWFEVKAIDGEIDSDCELARLIRSNRSTIFEKKKELQSIQSEVNSFLEDIDRWDDTKPLNKANKNQCKVVIALRESRSKLRERKLEFKSGHDKVGIARKDKQSQDQVVKEMWRLISPSSGKANSDGYEIGTALIEIKQYVSDAQIRLAEFNDIETEVNSLLEEINRWDDTKPLNKANNNQCRVVIALRESRSKLRERILEFKSGQHDKEELARNEKRSQEQVIMIQEILTIIGSTSSKVISGGDEIGTGLTVIKKYVSNAQGRLAEFNK
ncbi:uncharacterized protein LOC132739473 [Ruditapes philippinarum]|uniref:uncharacterized protein LOC132739473 n=1 Tax=Ruditapes philippinarum TaxID=129788 RepID=UPI00295B719E|nr:uncharacterized protein LOC132739473 [Ruditapes philippinarum]